MKLLLLLTPTMFLVATFAAHEPSRTRRSRPPDAAADTQRKITEALPAVILKSGGAFETRPYLQELAPGPSQTRAQDSRFKVGDFVEARWWEAPKQYYYASGGMLRESPNKDLRSLNKRMQGGDSQRDPIWYAATIEACNADNTYKIRYCDDDTLEDHKPPGEIRDHPWAVPQEPPSQQMIARLKALMPDKLPGFFDDWAKTYKVKSWEQQWKQRCRHCDGEGRLLKYKCSNVAQSKTSYYYNRPQPSNRYEGSWTTTATSSGGLCGQSNYLEDMHNSSRPCPGRNYLSWNWAKVDCVWARERHPCHMKSCEGQNPLGMRTRVKEEYDIPMNLQIRTRINECAKQSLVHLFHTCRMVCPTCKGTGQRPRVPFDELKEGDRILSYFLKPALRKIPNKKFTSDPFNQRTLIAPGTIDQVVSSDDGTRKLVVTFDNARPVCQDCDAFFIHDGIICETCNGTRAQYDENPKKGEIPLEWVQRRFSPDQQDENIIPIFLIAQAEREILWQ
jgi:hypothetical protein